MDYKEMIGFIAEQFNANNDGLFVKDGKVFKSMSVILVPNGIDLELVYIDMWGHSYHFEFDRDASEARRTVRLTVEPVFWTTCLNKLFSNTKRICFDRFKDWTSRSIFKTDDSPRVTTIHVRFDVPKPMSEHEFIEWSNSSKHLRALPRFTALKLGIPVSVGGGMTEMELRAAGQNPIHCTYYKQVTWGRTRRYIPVQWGNDEPSQPIPSKHDWSPSWDRDDRYNSGSYSECDEWCDYVDEVMRRDD